MKIVKIRKIEGGARCKTLDARIDNGYVKNTHGSLPDVDVDFDSDRRQEVKEYLERRYNHNGKLRVFSAGTFTTEKIRSVIKDVCRVHRVSVATANYITAIIDDASDWTDVMKLAFENKKVHDFIQKNWEVFEEIRPLMGQPRSAGIHASALIITPNIVKGKDVECFDILPIRKQNGMLVSEIDGYSIDDIGLLKNDVLAIAELSRLSDMMKICNKEYDANVSIPSILNSDLNDREIYKLIQSGLTQGIFQMSGAGMTRFMRQMHPDNINDLIAAIALFRPGSLNSGAAQGYCDAKNHLIEPEYLWGTYEALKDTYGYIVYQEQVSNIARSVGNLSLGDGVKLVKALSKKKIEKVRVFKEKFFKGADENGCPKEVADKIWKDVEDASKYLFNLSHATAYGLTGFVGAYIKCHYPVAFYTVLLKYVNKDNLPILMNEIRRIEGVTVVHPDINISSDVFVTDFSINKIFWSLNRIKQVGPNAVKYILEDRKLFGEYTSLDNFLDRIFKYKLKRTEYYIDPDNKDEKEKCPVNSRTVINLVLAGAFDDVEGITSIESRYYLLKKIDEILNTTECDLISEELRDKHYYWAQRQIDLSEMGSVDYKRIYEETSMPSYVRRYPYLQFITLDDKPIGTRETVVTCFRVSETTEKKYKDSREGTTKKFGKLKVQQNTDLTEVTLWSEAWAEFKDKLQVGKIIVAVCMVKYSDYDGKCVLQINKGAFLESV